jgi:ADP-ribose pyrophosphatase YjhB (NUDIX family)
MTPDNASMTPERAEYLAGLPKKRIAAGVLFSDDAGRCLIVEPTYQTYCKLPGAVVEADESPFAATARVIRDELSLSADRGRLLVVDWVPPDPNRIEGLVFVYDGGILSADQTAHIALPPAELRRWAWCDDAEMRTVLPHRMLRRANAARQARIEGATIYLENGVPVEP